MVLFGVRLKVVLNYAIKEAVLIKIFTILVISMLVPSRGFLGVLIGYYWLHSRISFRP